MKRFLKIFSLFLLFICTISVANTNLKIKVNNKKIISDVEPFIKNGTTYVPIRFVANALDIDSIAWDPDSKAVTIKSSNKEILLFANKNYSYVNNEYKNITNTVLLVNGRTFVPIRFVSEILGANVDWDEKNTTVLITTKGAPKTNLSSSNNTNANNSKSSENISKNSNLAQNNDSVYWLSRIIEAEAGGEPFKGKVAVGEVILNRVKSEEFPDTIWSVIFDNKFGIQFEPVANGTIYNTPSEESIKAAKTALNGSNYISNCLYFLNPTIASSNWIVKNREFYTTIANHDFYA